MSRSLERKKYRVEESRLRLKALHPRHQINEKRQRLADMEEEMRVLMEQKLTDRRHRLALLSGRLQGMAPQERISKGFGFITDEDGKRVESAGQVSPGQSLSVRLGDGTLKARVTEVTLAAPH